MKTFTIVISLVLSLLYTQAEPEKQNVNHKDLLATSLKAWEQAKQKCKGNYSYQVTTASMSGYRTATTITVRDNKVISRKFEEFYPAEIPQPEDTKNYNEDTQTLGSHKEGAASLTLDELYKKAAVIANKDLAAHEKRYFKLDKHGLLQYCFTIDTRIMDDAPTSGVNISNLKLLSIAICPAPIEPKKL